MSKYFLDKFVKNLREKSGLTQLEFAQKLGIGFSTLKMAELGSTSIPQNDFLAAISKYCNISEDEALQAVLYYDYLDFFSFNKDANALSLYTCHLYNNGYRIVDTKAFLKLNPNKFGYTISKMDEDHFINHLLQKKRENPYKLLEIDVDGFFGFATCVKKGNNPTKLVISVVSPELVFADVKNNSRDYYSCVDAIINSVSTLYPEFDYTNVTVSFVYKDNKNFHVDYIDDGLLTNKNDRKLNFNFVYVDDINNKYDVCFYK